MTESNRTPRPDTVPSVRWPYQLLYRGHVIDAMPEPLPHGRYRAKVLITETDADGRPGYGCVFFPAGGLFTEQADAAALGMALGRDRVDRRAGGLQAGEPAAVDGEDCQPPSRIAMQ